MRMIGSARHQGRRERAACALNEVLRNRTRERCPVAVQYEPEVFGRGDPVQDAALARMAVFDRWRAAPRMPLDERERQSRTFDRSASRAVPAREISDRAGHCSPTTTHRPACNPNRFTARRLLADDQRERRHVRQDALELLERPRCRAGKLGRQRNLERAVHRGGS